MPTGTGILATRPKNCDFAGPIHCKETAASDLTDTDTCKQREKPHETLFAKHPMKADITETATKGQAFFPCSTDFLDFKFPKLSLKVVEEPDALALENIDYRTLRSIEERLLSQH